MIDSSILVSSARSGTNFFLNIFGQLFEESVVLKEIFRKSGDNLPELSRMLGESEADILELARNSPSELWARLLKASNGTGLIAKIFYYHRDWSDPLWTDFRNCNRVIHLVRRNQFDVFVSRQLARETGVWQKFQNSANTNEMLRVSINRNEYFDFQEMQLRNIEATRKFFKGSALFEIYYEDIAVSPNMCAATISEIYGIPKPEKPIVSKLQKQKKEDNANVVLNYEDLCDLDKPCVDKLV